MSLRHPWDIQDSPAVLSPRQRQSTAAGARGLMPAVAVHINPANKNRLGLVLILFPPAAALPARVQANSILIAALSTAAGARGARVPAHRLAPRPALAPSLHPPAVALPV